jgi:hypothetical protein
MIVLGKKFIIHSAARRSITAEVPNPVISWGDKNLVVDVDNLPANITRLLPAGMLVENNPQKWESFIQAVTAKGLWK